jgi:hypothetical protein
MTEKKPKTKEIRIGAKDLGAMAMPDFCPRCFWIKQKAKPVPFQIFPGIFSTIDSYTRKIVHASFDQTGKPPSWLPILKNAFKYLKVPHWRQFKRVDPATGITVSGVMDDLFECVNGTLIIPDYKTAKFTANQDKLYPMYVGQLNTYAWIQRSLSELPIASLCLIYFQPVTDPPDPPNPQDKRPAWPITKYNPMGFDMAFSAHTLEVEQLPRLVPDLLLQAKKILTEPEPPPSLHGCKDCDNIERLRDMCGWI